MSLPERWLSVLGVLITAVCLIGIWYQYGYKTGYRQAQLDQLKQNADHWEQTVRAMQKVVCK